MTQHEPARYLATRQPGGLLCCFFPKQRIPTMSRALSEKQTWGCECIWPFSRASGIGVRGKSTKIPQLGTSIIEVNSEVVWSNDFSWILGLRTGFWFQCPRGEYEGTGDERLGIQISLILSLMNLEAENSAGQQNSKMCLQ